MDEKLVYKELQFIKSTPKSLSQLKWQRDYKTVINYITKLTKGGCSTTSIVHCGFDTGTCSHFCADFILVLVSCTSSSLRHQYSDQA